jgi:hypothetical protein
MQKAKTHQPHTPRAMSGPPKVGYPAKNGATGVRARRAYFPDPRPEPSRPEGPLKVFDEWMVLNGKG